MEQLDTGERGPAGGADGKRSGRSEHTNQGNWDRENHVELVEHVRDQWGEFRSSDSERNWREEGEMKKGKTVGRLEKGEVADDEVSWRCSMILRKSIREERKRIGGPESEERVQRKGHGPGKPQKKETKSLRLVLLWREQL